MNIEDLTIGQAKELAGIFGGNKSCSETLTKVGDKVFIRTLTYHYTGKVVKDTGMYVELSDCCWIPDSGRFHTAISKGELKEIEPIGTAKILYSNIVDCIEWKHNLPTEAK